MSYPKVRIANADNGRDKSGSLWGGALENFDQLVDYVYAENFDGLPFTNSSDASAVAGWWFQNSTAGGTGSFATGDSFGGHATLAGTTGTTHYAVEVHRGATATAGGNVVLPVNVADPQGDVVFEARVKSDKAQLAFVGLSSAAAELIGATSTLADIDYIGFFRQAGGNLTFVVNTAAGSTYSKNIVLAADLPNSTTFQKLGFRVNKNNSVQVFVDGVEVKADTSGDALVVPVGALPVDVLTEKFASGRGTGASTTSSLVIDWVHTYVSGN